MKHPVLQTHTFIHQILPQGKYSGRVTYQMLRARGFRGREERPRDREGERGVRHTLGLGFVSALSLYSHSTPRVYALQSTMASAPYVLNPKPDQVLHRVGEYAESVTIYRRALTVEPGTVPSTDSQS